MMMSGMSDTLSQSMMNNGGATSTQNNLISEIFASSGAANNAAHHGGNGVSSNASLVTHSGSLPSSHVPSSSHPSTSQSALSSVPTRHNQPYYFSEGEGGVAAANGSMNQGTNWASSLPPRGGTSSTLASSPYPSESIGTSSFPLAHTTLSSQGKSSVNSTSVNSSSLNSSSTNAHSSSASSLVDHSYSHWKSNVDNFSDGSTSLHPSSSGLSSLAGLSSSTPTSLTGVGTLGIQTESSMRPNHNASSGSASSASTRATAQGKNVWNGGVSNGSQRAGSQGSNGVVAQQNQNGQVGNQSQVGHQNVGHQNVGHMSQLGHNNGMISSNNSSKSNNAGLRTPTKQPPSGPAQPPHTPTFTTPFKSHHNRERLAHTAPSGAFGPPANLMLEGDFVQAEPKYGVKNPCWVCGEEATVECNLCPKVGLETFFCSGAHQQSVWKHHVRTCHPVSPMLASSFDSSTNSYHSGALPLPLSFHSFDPSASPYRLSSSLGAPVERREPPSQPPLPLYSSPSGRNKYS